MDQTTIPRTEYETVIGLEVHVELKTNTKLFCSCENKFGAEPNTLTCPVCLGLPGTLPVLNEEAIKKHIKAALALNCEILNFSKFDRKNYFYPDMPKNYQISQLDLPLARKGFLEIDTEEGTKRKIGITRIHLEEDTGKSIHAGETGSIAQSEYTLLNYNRAGVPLLEIVSEPDMRNSKEAGEYLVNLKKILTWLDISDCKMEEGSLRCDANISLRPKGTTALGTKTEIKNMNSFRSVREALDFEKNRQQTLLEKGEKIIQETLGWEEDRKIAISMRSKEEAHDYRYFPEPDLPPLTHTREAIENIRKTLSEMPGEKIERYIKTCKLTPYAAEMMTQSPDFAEFFEKTAELTEDCQQAANWLMGDISKYLNTHETSLADTKLTPETLAQMIQLINEETISGKIGKKLIEELLSNGGNPREIIQRKNWNQITSQKELIPLIREVLKSDPEALDSYRNGKESIREHFFGQVMKKSKGKAGPKALALYLDQELKSFSREI